MNEDQLAKLKEVVALAAGFNSQRGDAVVVYSMNSLATPPAPAADGADPVADGMAAGTAPAVANKDGAPAGGVVLVLAALALVVVLAAIGFGLAARRKPARASLTAAERERMLQDVRQWIAAPAADAAGRRP